MPQVRRLRELPLHWRRRHTHTHIQALRLVKAAVVKISAGKDGDAASPLCSVVVPGSASFMPQDHSVNACIVCFGCAAGFCMFLLWVHERTAASTLPITHPESVAESFLHIGNVIVRHQDTSRARVQVVEPLVGDTLVAQVVDPRNLLPSSFGMECALQTPESCPTSQP